MGALFGGGPSKPPPPPPPQPMPDPLGPDILAARRLLLERRMGGSGRASTLLTGNTTDYSGDKLGSP